MTLSRRRRRRGQPLAMLVLLLAGWSMVRALLWQSPYPPASAAVGALPLPAARLAAGPSPRPESRPAPPPMAAAAGELPPPVTAVIRPALWSSALAPSPQRWSAADAWLVPSPPAAAAPPVPVPPVPAPSPALAPPMALVAPGLAGGHQLMFMAALARLPIPASLAAAAQAIVPGAPRAAAPALAGAPPALLAAASSRWSGDGWLLWRNGSAGLAAAGRASYGGSQAGAVLRYRLAAGGHAPAAYARVSQALAFRQGEAALGLSARPLAGVPLRLLGEARVQRDGGRGRVRPAAALVSELPPLPLPAGVVAEVYGQAGYVAGAGATPFFDAQATAERRALAAGPLELHLGAGAWAGGQKGASRLDLGPRASLRLNFAGAPSRLALDWRFRVAGDAAPRSGPALTVSAGF